MRSFVRAMALGCALLSWPHASHGQGYPNRNIVIVVPFAAGGVTDVLARLIAQGIQEKLGQPVVVENRPGAVVPYENVAKAAPNGYTLLFGGNSLTIAPALEKSDRFDPRRDLTAISPIATQPMIIVTRPDLPHTSLKGLIDAAKTAPSKFSYASPGHGTPMHMAAELLSSEVGMKLIHVPYRGAVPAMTDVMSGQVDIYYGTETSAGPHIEAKRMKALAVTSPSRLAGYPNIPTLSELGLPKASVEIWYALFGPPALELEPMSKIGKAVQELTASAEFQARLAKMQLTPWLGDSAALRNAVEREIPMWQEEARRAGIGSN